MVSEQPSGHSHDAEPWAAVGDHLALDFLNTTAMPRDVPFEWIGNGRDLLEWTGSAGALSAADSKRIAASWPAKELDMVAVQAIELREWFRAVLVRAKDKGTAALATKDLKRLNAMLAQSASYRQIEPDASSGGLRMVAVRPLRQAHEVLEPIAAAMADLICTGDLDLVHRCENPSCTLWFYDRTKGHRRRWCSQAVCGNRAKVAAFRRRQQLAQ